MKIGIDKIGFATSDLYVDMTDLAEARNVDPNKYLIGIGQSKMAVIPPSQDAVTLAASAADKILTATDKEEIDLVLFATESGVDNSKSAAAYLSQLLWLKPTIRAIELKQACYGATAGLQLAKGHIAINPDSKVLLIGADIARYGLNTPGEPTQGGGAVAMLITAQPRILALENDASYLTKDIMDFWRPLGHVEALVDGKYSSNVYLDFFTEVFHNYQKQTGFTLSDFAALLFHLPYTKMGLKALRLALVDAVPELAAKLTKEFENARLYNNQVGNLYTGSLYLSLLSLLENSDTLRAGQRLGLFSYGSGAVGEFYSGLLQPNFKQGLIDHSKVLAQRKQVSVTEYEELYCASLKVAADIDFDWQSDPAKFVLTGIKNNQRKYLTKK